jgi:hypothetical protein
MTFTCLSHDVVAHETTHALLDGLRPRFIDPSSPEQAGFHEGFADLVALLSIYSLTDVVALILDDDGTGSSTIASSELTAEKLRDKSLVFDLAREVGQQLDDPDPERRGTLRRSITMLPKDYSKDPNYNEPHFRGELLVAAMMNAFLEIWIQRIQRLYPQAPVGQGKRRRPYLVDRARVVEEGATIADQLLTMSIRAIDYCPPTDIQFRDFLSALLTADHELRPDDAKFKFRETLRTSFSGYGINPTSKGDGSEAGVWEPPDCEVSYARVHLDSMRHDRDEIFRFLWENRLPLGLDADAYTRVLSVRPAVRVNPDDGFVLRETVAEYQQILNVVASELKHLGIQQPDNMPASQQVTLYGGGALVFDEFGHLKFHIRNRLLNPDRQTQRLAYLWKRDDFETYQILEKEAHRDNTFARMHLRRFGTVSLTKEDTDDDNFF